MSHELQRTETTGFNGKEIFKEIFMPEIEM
jgi:hypothetical protein